MTDKFDSFKNLKPEIINALQKQGIIFATEIQQVTFPAIMGGKDIIATSMTGTGKTLAYLVPCVQMLNFDEKNVQSMILAPTHELAAQIHKQCVLLFKNMGLSDTECALLIGGSNMSRQVEALKGKPKICIGTAGRIIELFEAKKIKMHCIKTIVLDEGDRLLEQNFISDVKSVIKFTQKDRQLLLFSASINKSSVSTANEMMKEPELFDLKTRELPWGITHLSISCELRDKFEMLRKLLNTSEVEKAIVFVNSPFDIEAIVSKLKHNGIECEGIHGGSKKKDKYDSIRRFKLGTLKILVSSDLIARGMDFDEITHVISFDFPSKTQDYIHRAGRVGRIGKNGVSIVIISEPETEKVKKLAKALTVTFISASVSGGKIVQ